MVPSYPTSGNSDSVDRRYLGLAGTQATKAIHSVSLNSFLQVENEALLVPWTLVLSNLDRAGDLFFFKLELKIAWSLNCHSERKSLLPLFLWKEWKFSFLCLWDHVKS